MSFFEILMSSLSILVIFTITPRVNDWISKKSAPYFSKRFPISEIEKEALADILSPDNPKRKKLMRYATFEILLIIMVLAVVFLSLWFLPVGALKGGDTLMLFGFGLSMIPVAIVAFGLGIAISYYFSKFITRLIYKFFNGQETAHLIDYTNIILSGADVAKAGFNSKALNKSISLFLLLVYPVCAYIAYSNIDILSRSHFHKRTLFSSSRYDVDTLNFKLYPSKSSFYLEIKTKESNETILNDDVQEGSLAELKEFLQTL